MIGNVSVKPWRKMFVTALLTAIGFAFLYLCGWGSLRWQEKQILHEASNVTNHAEMAEFCRKYSLRAQNSPAVGKRNYFCMRKFRLLFLHRSVSMMWEFDENNRIKRFSSGDFTYLGKKPFR